MITFRRSEGRHRDRARSWDIWLTFDANHPEDPLAKGFGVLRTLNEGRIFPGANLRKDLRLDGEFITYVRKGALTYQDSLGRLGVICAGEFQHRTSGTESRYREANASLTDEVQVFQVGLRPSELGLEPSHEEERFTSAERRGRLCVVASPDGRQGSIRLHQDAVVYSALANPGQHLIHELASGRSAWLHVVLGKATFGEVVLAAGDGVGVTNERAISVTAREESELLLLDLADPDVTVQSQ